MSQRLDRTWRHGALEMGPRPDGGTALCRRGSGRARNVHLPPPRSPNEPGQVEVEGTRRTPQAAADHRARAADRRAASLLLTGCASDRDEGVAAFPPIEQTTSLEKAWVADVGTLLDQRDASLESAWRTRLDSVTDLNRSGAPYAFEQIAPKA